MTSTTRQRVTRRAKILMAPIPVEALRRAAGGPETCRCGRDAEYSAVYSRGRHRYICARCATKEKTIVPGSQIHAARVLDAVPWAAR